MARAIGLKDISIAVLEQDDKDGVKYGAVEKLERSVSAKITPKSNSENLYSDDSIEDVAVNFSQVDVEIEVNQLSIPSRAKIFNSKVVNGILIENSDDVTTAPYMALIFKSKKLNGSYRYVCLYKGKWELVEDDYNTEEDKIKTSTAKIKGTFMARTFDNVYKVMADGDDPTTNVQDLEKWFVAVPIIPTKSNSTIISVITGKTTIVTNILGTALTVATGTTVSNLISAIQVDSGKGAFKIYTDDTKATEATGTSNITPNMVVEATAEDTTTKSTYTITIS
jgi:phi13 family phage major tail protein